jgi:hypothetical protein
MYDTQRSSASNQNPIFHYKLGTSQLTAFHPKKQTALITRYSQTRNITPQTLITPSNIKQVRQSELRISSQSAVPMHKMCLMLRRHKPKNPPHPPPQHRGTTNRQNHRPTHHQLRQKNQKQKTLHSRNEKNPKRRKMRLPEKQPLHHIPPKTLNLQVLPPPTHHNTRRKTPIPLHHGMPRHKQRQTPNRSLLYKTAQNRIRQTQTNRTHQLVANEKAVSPLRSTRPSLGQRDIIGRFCTYL